MNEINREDVRKQVVNMLADLKDLAALIWKTIEKLQRSKEMPLIQENIKMQKFRRSGNNWRKKSAVRLKTYESILKVWWKS